MQLHGALGIGLLFIHIYIYIYIYSNIEPWPRWDFWSSVALAVLLLKPPYAKGSTYTKNICIYVYMD